ncbi:hypothetical protein Golob_027938, partial [Gossypium lobatum]|nr:hypothetical protein [Gossypium lobatum]
MRKCPKIWTRTFGGTTCKSDLVDNNLCEAFNSSIAKARFKSIIRIFEDIKTNMMRLQLDDYLHEFYHIETYKSVYSFPIQPINGPHDWEKTDVKLVLPPIERKMIGRPKKNRMTAKDESKKLKSGHLSRKCLIMTCTQ